MRTGTIGTVGRLAVSPPCVDVLAAMQPFVQPHIVPVPRIVPGLGHRAVRRAVGGTRHPHAQPPASRGHIPSVPMDQDGVIYTPWGVPVEVASNRFRRQPETCPKTSFVGDIRDRVAHMHDVVLDDTLPVRVLFRTRGIKTEGLLGCEDSGRTEASRDVVRDVVRVHPVHRRVRVDQQQRAPDRRAVVVVVGRVGVGDIGVAGGARAIGCAHAVIPERIRRQPRVRIRGDICTR